MRNVSVYIAGPITGVPEYWVPFDEAADELRAAGYVPLSPATLPEGLTNAQYMRMCFAMIDSADAVLLLPGWENSPGARLEWQYADYIDKVYAEGVDALVCLRALDEEDEDR